MDYKADIVENEIENTETLVQNVPGIASKNIRKSLRSFSNPKTIASLECLDQILESSMKKFSCSVCKKSLSTKETLRKHILSQHIKLKPFECHKCDKKFVFEKALLAHKDIHNKIPQYVCLCGKKFKVLSSYTDHIRRLHQAVPASKLPCSICEKSFYDHQTLRMHLNSVHKPKTIKCSHPSCNKRFSTISLMHAHSRCHSECYSICPECGKGFKNESYLQRHYLTHKGIRPHRCDDCFKTYLSVSHLNQHRKRAHSVVANFQCVFCGKCFKTKEQVTYHENAHQDQKPFECNICDYKTAYRNALCSHKKTVHSEYTESSSSVNLLSTTLTGTSKKEILKKHKKNEKLGNVSPKIISNSFAASKDLRAKPKSKLSRKRLIGKCSEVVGEFNDNNLVNSTIFNNLDINDNSSLSVEGSFLKASPVNMVWDSDIYPDWVYPHQSTPEAKNIANDETTLQKPGNIFPKGRPSKNVTLNSTVLDYPSTKADTSFSNPYYDY